METANLIFDCLSLNLHLYIYIHYFCCFECISWYEISSSSFGDIIFHWYHENCQSHIWLSLSQSSFIYIYISLFLCWMYLIIWSIVFFLWRYNISLISWNCQSQIRSSPPLFLLLYIYIINFNFDVSYVAKYRLILFGDIIFHWHHEIANLSFDRLSLSFHLYIYTIISAFDVSRDMKYRLLLLAI